MDEKKSSCSVENWLNLGGKATFHNNLVTIQQGSAFGEKKIEFGQHEWSIKSTYVSKSCQWVGISSDTSVTSGQFTNKPNNILWCCGCRYIQGNVGKGNTNIASIDSWNSGDVIKVKLDLDKKTVSFYKNDDKNPVYTYANLPVNQYHIAVYGQAGNSFQIMESKLIGLSLSANILPRFEHSEQLLTKIRNSTEELTVEGLIECKEDIKKLLVKVTQFTKALTTLDSQINNQLNPDKSKYESWTVANIVFYLCSLENGKFSKYKNCLLKNMKKQEIGGSHLQYLDQNILLTLGVESFGDRLAMQKAIKKLIAENSTNVNNSNNNGNDDEEGETDNIVENVN